MPHRARCRCGRSIRRRSIGSIMPMLEFETINIARENKRSNNNISDTLPRRCRYRYQTHLSRNKNKHINKQKQTSTSNTWHVTVVARVTVVAARVHAARTNRVCSIKKSSNICKTKRLQTTTNVTYVEYAVRRSRCRCHCSASPTPAFSIAACSATPPLSIDIESLQRRSIIDTYCLLRIENEHYIIGLTDLFQWSSCRAHLTFYCVQLRQNTTRHSIVNINRKQSTEINLLESTTNDDDIAERIELLQLFLAMRCFIRKTNINRNERRASIPRPNKKIGETE